MLFFKETIGNVPVSRLLGDMYMMEKYTNGSGSSTALAHNDDNNNTNNSNANNVVNSEIC